MKTLRGTFLIATLVLLTTTSWALTSTTTTLTLSNGTITGGQTVALTATVKDASNAIVGYGSVTFMDGTRVLGTAQLVHDGSKSFTLGTANLKTGSFQPGVHSLKATFNGTASLSSSSSSTQTLTVNARTNFGTGLSSTLEVTEPTSSTAKVRITAPAPPATGTVNFMWDSTVLTSGTLATDDYWDLLPPVAFNYKGCPVAGDLNYDGNVDVVVVATDSGYAISSLGTGTGSFGAQFAAASAAVVTCRRSALADLNGDGVLDLLMIGTTKFSGGTLYVALGKGNGTFDPWTEPTPGGGGVDLVIGDFDKDGIPDVAVVSAAYTDPNNIPSRVNVFLGNGDGTLKAVVNTDITSTPTSIVAADVNGDGILDLLLGGTPNVVLIGNGDGTFNAGPTFASGYNSSSVDAADLDGDGKVDLVTLGLYDSLHNTGGNTEVWHGDGAGNFSHVQTLLTGPYSFPSDQGNHVTIADSDGDGILDLYSGFVAISKGHGDGTFDAPRGFVFDLNNNDGQPPRYPAADFNNDGFNDLLGRSSVYIVAPQTSVATTQDFAPLPSAAPSKVVAHYLGDSVHVSNTVPTGIVGTHYVGTGPAFPLQTVGTQGPTQTINLTAVGQFETINSTSIDNSDFSLKSNTCGTYAIPGQTCTVGLAFTPHAVGTSTGNFTMNEIQTASLSGKGTYLLFNPPSITFTTVPVGQSSTANLDVTNTGSNTVFISGTSLTSSPAITINTNGCTSSIAAGAKCTVQFKFQPQVNSQVYTADFTMTDNEASSPQVIHLTGTGGTPQLAVNSPNGTETWTTSSTHTITWQYQGVTGNVTLTLLKGGIGYRAIATVPVGQNGTGSYQWNLPANLPTGADYKIRVLSVDAPSVYDASDGNFDIVLAPDSLKVTSPNGGEGWTPGTTKSINWTYTGNPGNVNIALLKAGVPYTTIASNVSVGTNGSGTYSWVISRTIPSGTDYQVSITSVSSSSVTDTSNSTFTLLPWVQVASPNGGETWAVGTSHAVQWNYGGAPGNVNITLLKGGVGYSTIATGISVGTSGVGSFNWNIPNLTTGSNYTIRVMSATTSSIIDVSDAPFSLSAPPPNAVTVTSPNGGEGWTPGVTHNITWNYTGNPGPVNIALLKAGVPYTAIASNVSVGTNGSGTYSWAISRTIPSGTDYQIRVMAANDHSIYDSSNSYFTMLPWVQVTSPNGGENWALGSTHAIQWAYGGATGNVNITLLKGGVGYLALADNIPVGTNGVGSFTWNIPAALAAGSDYTVRVMSATTSSIIDVSDATFSLSAASSTVTVTSPNGAEGWTPGTTKSINWTYTGNPGNVNITLLKAGVTYATIASNVSVGMNGNGIYSWVISKTIPSGSDYQVSVTSASNASITDTSNNTFTLLPWVQVTAANGGENWTLGSTHSLQWTYGGAPGNVNITLLKGGVGYATLATTVPVGTNGAGSYNWSIPANLTIASDYTIRVMSATTSSIIDVSDGNFSLSAAPSSVTVTSPNGGESWQTGTTHSIQWSYIGLTGNVDLAILKAGVGYDPIATVPIGANGTGSYSWTIPAGYPASNDYTIRIISATDGTKLDVSDAPFTLTTPAKSITVTSPNGGESWQVGTTHTIQWNSIGLTGYVDLAILKAGVGYDPIATVPIGTNGTGSYSWTIPASYPASNDYTIRVISEADNTKLDVSDASFALTTPPATIALTSPNGGESWQFGTQHAIQWIYSGAVGSSINIDLYKSGVFYSNIGASISTGNSGSGSYNWVLPATLVGGTDYAVRIASNSNPSANDYSDLSFTLNGKAAGAYYGSTSDGSSFEAFVLPNDRSYVIYGQNSGNIFYVDGMMTGQGSSNLGTYSASMVDFYYTGSIYSANLSASYLSEAALSGSIAELGSTETFEGVSIPDNIYQFDTPAVLSDITGSWTGILFDGSSASLSISSNGSFAGSDSGCAFSGQITPDSSMKNFFNISLKYGASPCLSPNLTLSGMAIDYLLSDGVTRQLIAAISSGSTSGTLFLSTR